LNGGRIIDKMRTLTLNHEKNVNFNFEFGIRIWTQKTRETKISALSSGFSENEFLYLKILRI
jgi:hypothetical protein